MTNEQIKYILLANKEKYLYNFILDKIHKNMLFKKGDSLMKVLGEKSLSSKVEIGLKILFLIIVIIDIITVEVTAGSMFFQFNSFSVRENYTLRIVLETTIGLVFSLTGIVALYIIYQFIKIFRNLKVNKLFEKDNAKYLSKISLMSIVIGILYLICFIGVSIFFKYFNSMDFLSNFLLKTLILVFAVAFLIFGIGIKILNYIYLKAIEYKEENDFTI